MTSRTNTAQLCRFMIRILEFLGQPRWMVNHIDKRERDGTPDDDVDAETDYSHDRFVVSLWVNERVYGLSHHDQIRILVHEALHSIHVGIDRMIYSDWFGHLMHDEEHSQVSERYCNERELMVDALSLVIMDLPVVKRFWRESLRD